MEEDQRQLFNLRCMLSMKIHTLLVFFVLAGANEIPTSIIVNVCSADGKTPRRCALSQISLHIFKDGRQTRGRVSAVGLSVAREAASPRRVTMRWPYLFTFKGVSYCYNFVTEMQVLASIPGLLTPNREHFNDGKRSTLGPPMPVNKQRFEAAARAGRRHASATRAERGVAPA